MYWVRESEFSYSAINLENIKNIRVEPDRGNSAFICFDKAEKWYFNDVDKALKVYFQLIQGTYPCVNDKGLKL